MKKVNPLFPKIGYILGSVVIFIAWVFNTIAYAWHLFLRFIKLEHERQKQGFHNISSGSLDAEKWFFLEDVQEQVEPSIAAHSLSGDA